MLVLEGVVRILLDDQKGTRIVKDLHAGDLVMAHIRIRGPSADARGHQNVCIASVIGLRDSSQGISK